MTGEKDGRSICGRPDDDDDDDVCDNFFQELLDKESLSPTLDIGCEQLHLQSSIFTQIHLDVINIYTNTQIHLDDMAEVRCRNAVGAFG